MNKKTLAGLAGALVLFAALFFVGQPEQQSPTRSGELFLPELSDALNDLQRIELLRRGSEPVTTLERNTTGWTVLQKDGYPADLNKTRHALLSLSEAQILEPKTANPDLHDRLGVEDISSDTAGGTLIRLVGLDDPAEIIVGDAEGDYQRYVRQRSEDQAYLINRDPELGTSADDWVDTAIVDIDAQRVQQVTITRPDGEVLSILKQTTGQPNFTVENIPVERTLSYESIANGIGGVLDDLSLDDVARLDVGTGDAVVTEVRTFDGLVVSVESRQIDEDTWVNFLASADPLGNGETEGETAAAEAAEINQRVVGWQYRIPTQKYDQMTRRMEDLLRATDDQPASPPSP